MYLFLDVYFLKKISNKNKKNKDYKTKIIILIFLNVDFQEAVEESFI